MVLKLSAWSLTDPGLRRERNEDDFLVDEPLAIYAVADGMGGHKGGEQASRLALEVFRREVEERMLESAGDHPLPDDDAPSIAFMDTAEIPIPVGGEGAPCPPLSPSTLVYQAAQRASNAVFDVARGDPNLRGMGTTLTAMVIDQGRAYIAHAGDSRAYRLRGGVLEQVTEDHSWAQEQVKAGMMTEDEARISEFRHVITRSIGFERHVQLETRDLEIEDGDAFLLCSDGMSNYFDTAELQSLMQSTPPAELPAELVRIANARGGDDNITVVVVTAAVRA